MKGNFISFENAPEVKPMDMPKSIDEKAEVPSDKTLFDSLKDIFYKKDGKESPPEVPNIEANPLENEDSGKITLPDGTVIELPKTTDDFVDNLKQTQENSESNTSSTDLKESAKAETRLPTSNGSWEGEKGNSTWKPDPDYVPLEKSRNPERPYSNPESLTWGEIMEKYGIDGIEYKDGYPVFDKVSRGTVEIDDFTDDRGSNFDQADEKMAEQRGCTPEEVAKWREENGYTWHECQDCKTMQKVPNEVHANVPHDGGVSVYKSNN